VLIGTMENFMTGDNQNTGGGVLEGRVVSARMDKTITVEVTRMVKHPRYRKYVSRRKNYKAHDEENVCQEGDFVVIRSTRPLSKTKRWVLVERRSA
jgi:small subunit ribosomal protein S17